MKISDITTLGRTPIDPSYPTNRAIAALALVVAIAGTIVHLLTGAALLESVLWGIGAGFVPFLTLDILPHILFVSHKVIVCCDEST